MTLLRGLGRVTFIVFLGLCGPWAVAMSIAPPQAISLLFEAHTDRLTRDGLQAAEWLALRAAQCPAGALAVHVRPARGVGDALTERRMVTIRRQLERLGLTLIVEAKPMREEETEARPLRRDVLLADVGSDDDVRCDMRSKSAVFTWAREMGRFVEGTAAEPVFWRRLSKPGRAALALPLAAASLCGEEVGCTQHPELFHWLAEKALPAASPKVRRLWLLSLWTQAEDANVERFRRRWGQAPLTLEERAGQAHELAAGGLPWAVIEQRLSQPGVMARFGELPMIAGGPGPHGLLSATSRRSQLDAFDRLIDTAGPARVCFTMGAFWEVGGDQEQFDAWEPHFAHWAQGALTPFQPKGSPASCDAVTPVVREAFCGLNPADVTARFVAIWDVLRQAGVTLDSPAVRQFTDPGDDRSPCKLEPVPGSTSRLRVVAQP